MGSGDVGSFTDCSYKYAAIICVVDLNVTNGKLQIFNFVFAMCKSGKNVILERSVRIGW